MLISSIKVVKVCAALPTTEIDFAAPSTVIVAVYAVASFAKPVESPPDFVAPNVTC